MKVYRIQDLEGRGPFKPGFSKFWCDEYFAPGQKALPTWMEKFGHDAIDRLARPGERYFGSAVRTMNKLDEWFSRQEQEKLLQFGYNSVVIIGGRILAESENQLLIARHISFAKNCLIVRQVREPPKHDRIIATR